MRIGLIVELYRDKEIRDSFSQLHDIGISSCQLVCWDRSLLSESTEDKVRAAVKDYDIDITAFWCGWEGRKVWDFYEGQLTLGLVPAHTREKRMEMLMEGSDFAKQLGIRDFVTHVGFLPENPFDPKYFEVLSSCKEIVLKCRDNDQHFLFETGQETPITLKRTIQDIEKDIGPGNVGINLDPANLLMYGKANPIDALDIFGEYVRGVHGKDGLYPTNGHFLGKEVPLGRGKVNYPVFIQKLKDIGYNGDITIEREIVGEEQIKDILSAKKMLMELIL